MTKFAYALHQIVLDGTAVEPGDVLPIEAGQFDELLSLGAVRKPTADEIALFNMVNGVRPAPAPPVVVEPVTDERATLEARATAAGVTFRSNTPNDKLLERILEAEQKAREDETGVTAEPQSLI